MLFQRKLLYYKTQCPSIQIKIYINRKIKMQHYIVIVFVYGLYF